MTVDPDLSVVIPFHNEAGHAAEVVAEVVDALGGCGASFDVVLVDDGSSDDTARVLREAALSWPCCRVLQHDRNAGQGAALLTGLRAARGKVLATLDGDGQSVPADLPAMLDRLREADLVQGVRVRRHDSAVRRAMSAVANGVRRRWLQDGAHDAGCAVRVFNRRVADSLIPIRTIYSFVPACAVAAGWRVVEHPVRHRPRRSGAPHYSLAMMWWRPLFDMLALGWLAARRPPHVSVRELPPLARPEAAASQQAERHHPRQPEHLEVIPRQHQHQHPGGRAHAEVAPPARRRP